MLPEKTWSGEAVARLVGAIFAAALLGQFGQLLLRYRPDTAPLGAAWFYTEVAAGVLAFLGAIFCLVRPWRPDNFRRRGVFLLICFYAGLSLLALAQKGAGTGRPPADITTLVISALSFQGAAIALIIFLTRQQGGSVRETYGLRAKPLDAALLGMTVAFAAVPLGLGMNYAISATAKAFNIELPAQDAVLILRLADSWSDRLVLGVVAMVLAPLAEEGLFRGILYPVLLRFTSPGVALWGSSVVFAASHFNALTFVPLVGLSIALTLIYRRSGNLLAPIACHATFNACNFVLLFLADRFLHHTLTS